MTTMFRTELKYSAFKGLGRAAAVLGLTIGASWNLAHANPNDGSTNSLLTLESATVIDQEAPGKTTVELIFDKPVTLPADSGVNSFGVRKNPVNASAWSTPVLEDLNGDQKPDLVMADGLTIYVYLNTSGNGEMLFGETRLPIATRTILNPGTATLFHNYHHYTAVSFGDADNDGDRDLICGEQWYGNVLFFPLLDQAYQPGQLRQFGSQLALEAEVNGQRSVIANAIGDVTTASAPPGTSLDLAMAASALIKYDDNDSYDLLVADNTYNLQKFPIFWIYPYAGRDSQTGAPYYSEPIPFKINGQQATITSSSVGSVPTLVDVDGQNGPDLVVSLDNGRIYIAMSMGYRSAEGYPEFGDFQPLIIGGTIADFAYDSFAAVPMDLDEDGDLDLLSSSVLENGASRRVVKVHRSTSGGTLGTLHVPGVLLGTGDAVRPYLGAEELYSNIRLSDFNHDGKPDLVQRLASSEIGVSFSTDTGNNFDPMFASPLLCKTTGGAVFKLSNFGLLNPVGLSIFDADADGEAEGLLVCHLNTLYYCAKDGLDDDGCVRLSNPVQIPIPSQVTAGGGFTFASVDIGDFTPNDSTHAANGALLFKEGGFGTGGVSGREVYWMPIVSLSPLQFGAATCVVSNANDFSVNASLPYLYDVDGDGDLDAVTCAGPTAWYEWWENKSGAGSMTSMQKRWLVRNENNQGIYSHYSLGFCFLDALDPEETRPLVIAPARIEGESQFPKNTRLFYLNGVSPSGSLLVEEHPQEIVRLDQTLASSVTQESPNRLRMSVPMEVIEGDDIAVNLLFVGVNPVSFKKRKIGGQDEDEDGLSYAWEMAHGLNPNVADTDNDGKEDGWEVNHGSDPSSANDDLDGDGLGYQQELAHGSDPLLVDTDGDGIPDPDDSQPTFVNSTEATISGLRVLTPDRR